MIEVELPDGSIAEFPDGTPNDVIKGALQRRFPKPQAPAEMPEYDAAGNATGSTVSVQPNTMGYGEQMGNVGRVADDTVRMLANGASFGLADKAAGGMDALTGQAESYDAGVQAQRGRTQDIRDAHPNLAAAGEVAGGVLTGGALVKNGATLAGRMGPKLFPRLLGYGAEGAAYGGAAGAGATYSDDPMNYLSAVGEGAIKGGIIGTGLPAAGAGAGAIWRALNASAGPRIAGASRPASTILRGAAQGDEEGLRRLTDMGDEAMLVDAGPSMLGLGQGAATANGPGKSALVNALRERDMGTGPRLARVLDNELGPAPIPSRVDAEIVQGQRSTGPLYEDAISAARPVDTEELAENLTGLGSRLRGGGQKAAKSVRTMLDKVKQKNEPGATSAPNSIEESLLDENPVTLLETRKAIDGMLATENDPSARVVLMTARKDVDNLLADAAPGIKDVDARYAELARQKEGLQRGGQILDGGKTAIRPEELVDEIAAAARPEGTLVGPSAAAFRMRQGSRADLDRVVGTNVNDLNALERTLATPQDWNYQKIGAMHGEGPRNRIAEALNSNRRMRGSYQSIAQGSQTAQRTEAAKRLADPDAFPMDTTLTGAGIRAGSKLARALLGVSKANTRDELARVLSTKGGNVSPIVEALLEQAQRANSGARLIDRTVANPAYLAPIGQYAGQR